MRLPKRRETEKDDAETPFAPGQAEDTEKREADPSGCGLLTLAKYWDIYDAVIGRAAA